MRAVLLLLLLFGLAASASAQVSFSVALGVAPSGAPIPANFVGFSYETNAFVPMCVGVRHLLRAPARAPAREAHATLCRRVAGCTTRRTPGRARRTWH